MDLQLITAAPGFPLYFRAPNLQDLRESNEFLNHLLDNMGAAVLIADENYQIHQFNDDISVLGVEYTGPAGNLYII